MRLVDGRSHCRGAVRGRDSGDGFGDTGARPLQPGEHGGCGVADVSDESP